MSAAAIEELVNGHDVHATEAAFIVAKGKYWYCAENYSGQHDPLYRELCESEYSPGNEEYGIDDDNPYERVVYTWFDEGRIE
jgi:hypothetical protein